MPIDPGSVQRATQQAQQASQLAAQNAARARDAHIRGSHASHSSARGNVFGLLILFGGGFYLYKHPELIGVIQSHIQTWLAAANS
ncbi:hypothetical protein ACFV0T_40095 [Streptomyces sp. NPDC059582]|uniref:hypothetical protein n=1 Tax=Streptomyces sp. NPDC059582 TaxID=3346875 RepID=UPI0036B4426A